MDHLGIDVHKNDSQLCILGERGERKEQRIPPPVCAPHSTP
jgi:hypothetical protein